MAAEVATACVGVVAMLYTGLLLQSMDRVAFWRSPFVPLLFLLSSLSGGVALVLLAAFFVERTSQVGRLTGFLSRADLIIAVLEAACAVGYVLWAQASDHPGVQASLAQLTEGDTAGAWWMGFCVCGLGVPLVVETAGCVLGTVRIERAGWNLVLAVVAGWLAASSIHIVLEWEKAVVLRLGKFNRVAGPGVVFTWPIIEFYTLRVDQRVSATYFGAEETLTSDLVPINVDAVVFWMVFSAKKACMEVEDYAAAVSWVAQTTVRKAIGRATVTEVAMRRDQLDAGLKEMLDERLSPWGIDIIDVEVRDIVVPKELQEAMAAEAVAERKKDARMVLAEAEKDIASMLEDAAGAYRESPEAMRLRTMHDASGLRERGKVRRHVGPAQFFLRGLRGPSEHAERRNRRFRSIGGEVVQGFRGYPGIWITFAAGASCPSGA